MTSRNEQSRSCGYRTFISQQRMFPVGRRLPRYVHGTVSALYRTSKLQYRRSAVVPRSRIRVVHPDAPPTMPLPYLANQTFVNTFRAIIASVSNRQSPSNLLGCNYMCEHSQVGSREPRDRYSGQPADPEHTGWLVRTSPPGHRLPGLLYNSARRRGVQWFPKFRLKC